ncbi:hypothetical protein ACFV85_23335 [Streptomyces niveus]|uniref:hypothetical protein n=1 Tax=Streptomyces niveus TaxID=193462 RepID=UPI003658EAE6
MKDLSDGHNKLRLDLSTAARTGQQMFLADLIHWKRPHRPPSDVGELVPPAKLTSPVRPLRLLPPGGSGSQLLPFEPVWDFRHLRKSEHRKGLSWTSYTPVDPQ